MKNILAIGAIGVLVLAPLFAGAADYRVSERSGSVQGGGFSGNAYVVGGTAIVSNDAPADLTGAGGEVTASGKVAGDVLLVGGTISLEGPVGGDARVAGGTVNVKGSVGGDLAGAGGTVRLFPGSTVGGHADLAGGAVLLSGAVNGNVRVFGGDVELDGPVDGDISVDASRGFTIGKNAAVKGKLIYRAPAEVSMPEGANIGAIEYAGPSAFGERRDDDTGRAGKFLFLGLWWFMRTVGEVAAGLALFFLLRRLMHDLVAEGASSFGREALRGFLMLVALPIGALIVLITGFGVFPAILVGVSYAMLLLLGSVMGGAVAGTVTVMALGKGTARTFTWQTVAGGILLLRIVGAVPVVGWLVGLTFFLVGMGVLGYGLRELSRYGRN